MSDFIKIETTPDFLKDFMIETPTETIEKKEKEIEAIKEKVEITETVKSLEELQKELEDQDKPEDKSKEENKEKEEKVETKEENKEEDKPEYSFKPFIETMAEVGVLDLPEGVEIGETAEDLVEAFETTVNKRIVDGITEYKESIPELGQAFLDYLEKGGDPRKFIEAQTGPIDFANVDLTDENTQKLLVREYLKTQDYTNAEIKEILQDYEDGLLLEKQAKLAKGKLEKIQEKQTEVLIKQQEAEVKQREQALNEYVTSVKKLIKDSKEIAGLAIADQEKKAFEDYLFKRDKSGLTQYQKDLNEDPIKTQSELAYLKFKKYDFAKVAKKAESTAASKIREKIIAKSETTVKGDSRQQNDKVNFSAFENLYKQMRKQ